MDAMLCYAAITPKPAPFPITPRLVQIKCNAMPTPNYPCMLMATMLKLVAKNNFKGKQHLATHVIHSFATFRRRNTSLTQVQPDYSKPSVSFPRTARRLGLESRRGGNTVHLQRVQNTPIRC